MKLVIALVIVNEIAPFVYAVQRVMVEFRELPWSKLLCLKETRNSYFCVTPKNQRLMFLS